MKTKKSLSVVLVLCLMLGCMGITALAAEESESIAPGQSVTLSVPVSGGYVDEYIYFSFTPDVSGEYLFSVSYDDSQETGLAIWLSVDDGSEYFSYGEPLMFSAEAGVTYWLCGNYFGNGFAPVEYTFLLQESQPLESITLSAEQNFGYVGQFLTVDVLFTPVNGVRETIEWTVSDSKVIDIVQENSDYVGVSLLGAGKATITASTASGLSDTIDITVMKLPELEQGNNKVTIPADNQVPFGFTPAADGYYLITVDNEDIGCSMNADTLYDGTNEYYVLEAGVTYSGYLYNWAEKNTSCTVSIEYFKEVVVVEPIAIEIVTLPDSTTYLRHGIFDTWKADCLSGLVLKVTWSDGSVSQWNYDENMGLLGAGYVGGFLNEKDDGGFEVEVYVSAAEVEPVFFDLTVLDIVAESVALVDDTPLQIVEFSCGMDVSALGLGGEGWYYWPFAAYDREVIITFSDGSTVKAKPGDVVYGIEVACQDNQGGVIMRSQTEGFWTKESENLIGYLYGELLATLTVEIIDSPVESIELVKLPEDTFKLDRDGNLIDRDGKKVESFKDLLDGMSLKVNYKDGTSQTFTAADIEWRSIMGMEYPFVDGYPLGVIGSDWLSFEEVEAPCELEGYVEYMGATATYTIHLVEKFSGNTDEPGIDINPDTGDSGMVLAVLVIAVLGASAIIVKNEKLMA